MKEKITALLAAAAICTATAVSCGDKVDDSVALDINSKTTSASEAAAETTSTEAASETTTKSTETTTVTEEEPSATTTTAPEEDNPDETSGTTTAAPVTTEPEQTTTEPVQQVQTGSFSSSDLNFMGTSLLSDVSGLISALGEPVFTEAAPGCLSNGADQKIYRYNGLDIYCYIDGGSEIVYDITISGGYSTPKGIYVGSSRAEVEAAYGKGNGGTNEVLYGSENHGLYIFYNGDTVSMIDYYSLV
ncbi:MAG: hypothetical protein J6L05_03495 [Ruminococcus sp.]|nr:hypothetical protein [Ruminococcus sp.]